MNFWIEKTIVKGRQDREQGERALGKAIWSPRKDKRGADIYKNMRLVNSGDIIIHLIDNKYISGISIAKGKAIETDGVSGTDWDGESYLIELEAYQSLPDPIDRTELLNNENRNVLDEISESSEVFYNKKLELRQGAYLTPCPNKLAALINNIYKKRNNEDLPHFENLKLEQINVPSIREFNVIDFKSSLVESGLIFQKKLITRFTSSLLTKPFVILSGLSGSGKTKLAQAFAEWICQDDNQYCLVPVGADWTNREPLLGYPNALKTDEYIKPDNTALDVIINANKHRELPHFLILDEMNLSHVERYFADFLSIMESKGEISLYSEGTVNNGVPSKLSLPANLFIIGTVNIDETTYMFSPKVLDRANAIEFRVTKEEMKNFFTEQQEVDMNKLRTQGASMAQSFLSLAGNNIFSTHDMTEIQETLLSFFEQLKKTGAEFGYRSASEIIRLINQLTVIDADLSPNEKLDIAIMQKLLPKLHGSRRKLCPVLLTLANFCIDSSKFENIEKEIFSNDKFDFETDGVLFPISLEKITRMYNGAIENGFASYAEA
ncbi:MAG: hypothetical protein V2I54_13240 [Bacteroidales bacterium]|jgi:hypothetical protein|nr:hypothetical protein [Bacteroidales bacterium]